MNKSTKWSEEAWNAAQHIYHSILDLPFVTELARGTLPGRKFLFYLAQDSMYLDTYSRMLAHVASRLDDKSHMESFLKFASDGIAVERALHESFICGTDMPPQSPSCLLYTSVQKASALEAVCVEAASLLPCFWVYQRVGEHIAATASNLDGNPYEKWIKTYGDESFAESTRRAIEICDILAENASVDERRRMTDIFVTCTRLEWLFWESAYNMEQWKV